MAGYILTAPSGPHSRIDNRVIDRMAELTVYAHGIYSYLVRMQNRTTGACFPSLKKIAKATGLDKKTVIKYLRVLEKEGLVKKKKRHTQTGRRTSNQYDILRFWEIAKQVIRNALAAGKEPPAIPGDPSVPSIDAAVRAREHDTHRTIAILCGHCGADSSRTVFTSRPCTPATHCRLCLLRPMLR